MRVKLQLVICHDDGHEETVTDIITLNKNHQRIEHLGLSLAKAKQLLSALQPRFKGSDRPRHFFGLKALHTTRSRGPAHDIPARGEAEDHRCAALLAHLSTIGPVL